MTSFGCFNRLPAELRLQIWELAAQEPRFVALYAIPSEFESREDLNYFSTTPPPAILHVCRESRACGTSAKCYRPAFRNESRHIWVNFDVDVMEVDAVLATVQFPEFRSVKHFRAVYKTDHFNQDAYAEYFFCYSTLAIKWFPSLQTFDLVVDDDLFDWTRFTRQTHLGDRGYRDIVRIVNFDTGEYITHKTSLWYEDWTLADRGLPPRDRDMRDYQIFIAAHTGLPADERDQDDDEPYTSDVCPSEFITPWVRPDFHVSKSGRPPIIEEIEEERRGFGDVEDSDDVEDSNDVENSNDVEDIEDTKS